MKNILMILAKPIVVLVLFLQQSLAMEVNNESFSLDKLPPENSCLIMSFVFQDLDIRDRARLELVSKDFTRYYENKEDHKKWRLLSLWKVKPYLNVSWKIRLEAFLCYKLFIIEAYRYDEAKTKTEKPGSEGVLIKQMHAYLDKACLLKDESALSQREAFKYREEYGYSSEGVINPNAFRMGLLVPSYILDHCGNNVEKYERMVKAGNKRFVRIKFQCLLEGKCGYKKDYEAARLFLLDSIPDPIFSRLIPTDSV